MQLAKFLSLAVVAIAPALAVSTTDALLYSLDLYRGTFIHSDGDASCITTPEGIIHSVELAPGMTCNLYFQPSCGGDPFPLKLDSPSLVRDIGSAALSARCRK
ncbi:hypothetical protein BO70DRAFT_400299 [Aspergillus heteromorphus CBS 117.55]|uniref:Uncharacterized protein n=1 Tax=Aspergillus heteromorphus CBS 117.55 TaxID=1448321 RepID=A0A317V338_9EURO|nr:uncharacterized protein BO70DRAFT_400299 [Aspergillus heteromorphus CBS 117.55]PWY68684.1 hypothetical protein BO70DRAFT_400299 [Aspergillus heteromorphus CBS 117.55]